jgi:hypothetical protein
VYSGYSADGTVAVAGVAPGTHTVTVALQNNDHSDVVPAVRDSVSVTVE